MPDGKERACLLCGKRHPTGSAILPEGWAYVELRYLPLGATFCLSTTGIVCDEHGIGKLFDDGGEKAGSSVTIFKCAADAVDKEISSFHTRAEAVALARAALLAVLPELERRVLDCVWDVVPDVMCGDAHRDEIRKEFVRIAEEVAADALARSSR